MKKKIIIPKILAPAGSFETLQAAIDAGADEVYFGIANFNMRATAAANFKPEDLAQIVKICAAKNVRTNMTLNTLLFDNELGKMRDMVDAAVDAGIDALIVADFATINYAKTKNIQLHISTQVSVSNIEEVRFFSQFADRIVLARELSLEQVTTIVKKIKEEKITGPSGKLLEIEVFAHGALCVAVSGRCAMSLYCYGTSANKGKCSHMCRRPYKVTDITSGKEMVVDNNYVMSASDLNTLGMLEALVESGVSILKIEGRGRPAEYVDTVVSTYKSALKDIQEGKYTKVKIKKYNNQVSSVFNRGFSKGLYMGRSFDEWAGTHGSKATKERVHIGVIEHYYPKIKIAQAKIQAKENLKYGDEYIIVGETTGIAKGTIGEMVVDDKPAKVAGQNDIVTFKVSKRVRKNDKFYVLRKRTSLIPRGKEKLIYSNRIL